MTRMKWLCFGVSLFFLVTIQHSVARAPVMFKTSRCFDGQGTVNVQLNCPEDYKIRVQTAFTGLSRSNACSYQAWDCVIQEGGLQQCNGKNQCAVNVRNSINKDSVLSCGAEGRTTYFQIEFDCMAADGRIAMVEESAQSSSYPNIQIPKLLSMPKEIVNNDDLIVQDDVNMIYEIKKSPTDGNVITTLGPEQPSFAAMAEDQVTLVAIVCGTSLALLLVIAVVAFVAYHRIKNRSYEQTRLYGPLGGQLSSIINPTLSRRERDLPIHMGNSNRQLPQPITCFDENCTPIEFSRPRPKPNYDFRRSIFHEEV